MENQPKPAEPIGELRGFFQRLCFALGPLGAGIVLDLLDFATFGPIGLFAGALVGGYAGWILGAYQNFDRNLRIAYAICTAAYMTIPFTETIPVATILVLVARFFEGPNMNAEPQPSVDATDPVVKNLGRANGNEETSPRGEQK